MYRQRIRGTVFCPYRTRDLPLCSSAVLLKPSNSLALTTEADTSGVPSVPSCAKIGVAYSEDRAPCAAKS